MANFVLIAGAWHGGWCWNRVVPLLDAAGHRAIAPDLLGMGADKTPLAGVTLSTWADHIADVISGVGEKVVLVGHSRAGIVISEVAERVPGLIDYLVYVSAYLVPSGESLLDAAMRVPADQQLIQFVAHENGTTTLDVEAAGATFYNCTTAEWADAALSRLCPEPLSVVAVPLALSAERFGSVRRAYVECTRDKAIPLSLQRMMQRSLPCEPVFTLETDHSPFFSAPENLVGRLVDLV